MNAFSTPVHTIKFRGLMMAAFSLLSVTLLINTATAQSGTKTAAAKSPAASGSGTKAVGSGTKAAGGKVALQGYCPVCVVAMNKWVKGNPNFAAVQDGKSYLFPGDEQKQMFLKDPARYTPVLGGDCVVALVEMGKRVPGSVQHAAIHDHRLYLFSNDKAKNMFSANRAKYVNADLALNGKCNVCRVEMNKDVLGVPQFTSLYKGLRYQFPGKEQQEMFDKNPAKYDVTK